MSDFKWRHYRGEGQRHTMIPTLLQGRHQLLLKVWCSFFLIVASLTNTGSGWATETQTTEELRERKTFIEKAIHETWWEAVANAGEAAKRGSHHMISVTTLTPFADWDYFLVAGSPIIWSPNRGQNYEAVVVPEGFVTDLASIPRLFWQILRPEGRYAYAAVVHDYLYWMQTRTPEEADMILRFAMEDSKVPTETVAMLYRAVRSFGQSAWDNNAELRKAGECRFVKRRPIDFTISWSEWKKQPDVCTSDGESHPMFVPPN